MTVQVDARPALDRINTVLAGWEAQPVADGDWMPGDPLYDEPRGYLFGEQHIRPLLEVIDPPSPALRCEPCDVSWSGDSPCWVCGTDRPEFPEFLATHDRMWILPVMEQVDFSPMVRSIERMGESLAGLSFEPFQRVFLDRWISSEKWDQAIEPNGPAPLPIDGHAYRRRRLARRRRR